MIKRFFSFLFSLFLSLFLFFGSSGSAYSQGEFITDVAVNYSVNGSGVTTVTHNITLENVYSDLYATSYTLTLENIEASNIRSYGASGQAHSAVTSKEGEKTSVKIDFVDSVVGKGKTRNFSIVFEVSSFATRTGEVWEVSIPRLSEGVDFRNYEVSMLIPSSFGPEAYISPSPRVKGPSDGGTLYKFSKSDLVKTGVTAGFGDFQVFSFELNYHLENPLKKSSLVEVAIPPDTSFQKVYYTDITPKPTNIYVDSDGNYIAVYNLNERERIDVKAVGSVQIFASRRPFLKSTQESLTSNLNSTEYWQTEDPKVKELANRLKTPRAIYDYVVATLSYDYERVRPNVARLGAIEALNNPSSAICMEFTDLFVALARSAGIPAREVNGYAYTENPDLQPLSLVADVLHAWPEYWDSATSSWIPVDPTWGSTTGGVDFFSKLDLRHFTFVVHGQDSTKPYPPGSYKLGPNPQKDIFVNFGTLPDERNAVPVISAETLKSLPFMDSKIKVTLTNPGPTTLYALSPKIYFDGEFVSSEFVEILPPLSSYESTVTVDFSFLGKSTPKVVTVEVLGSQITVTTNKNQVIIYNLLLLFILLCIIVGLILLKLKKATIAKFIAKIAKYVPSRKNKKTETVKEPTEISP